MPVPEKLAEIVEDFASMTREEKLETLLGYAETLPELPERLRPKRTQMEEVPECMTPVRVFAELEGDGGLQYFFEIPPQAPTVRGLASILASGLNGSKPEEILAVPADFFLPMKLNEAISQQRITGFIGLFGHMKHLAVEHLERPQGN